MKAKDYYRKMVEACDDQDKFEECLVGVLTDLSNEAADILARKSLKTSKEKMNAIQGVISKWERIIELAAQDTTKESEPMKMYKFNKLGFIASFVELHPEHGDLFDIDTFKKELLANEKQRQEAARNMPVKLTPLEQVTKETISMELMMCYHNMKSAYDMFCVAAGMSHTELAEYVRPLTRRIGILTKWMNAGEVDYNDIENYVDPGEDTFQLRANDICNDIMGRIMLEPLQRSTFREVPHHYVPGNPDPVIDGEEQDSELLIQLREFINLKYSDFINEGTLIEIEYNDNDGSPQLIVKIPFKDSVEIYIATIPLMPSDNTK